MNEDNLDDLVREDKKLGNNLNSIDLSPEGNDINNKFQSLVLCIRKGLNRELEISTQHLSIWVLLIFLAFGFISINCVSLSQDEVDNAQIHTVYVPEGD